MKNIFSHVFVTSFLDQKKTLQELLEESRDRADFYILLMLATFIATLGLLSNNVAVIIGGMLIAPILFPILGLAMGIVTSSGLAIGRSFKILIRSVGLVLGFSIITAFLFGAPTDVGEQILLRIEPDLNLFLIAFAAGLAVSYSWVKQNLSAALPGIAVAVALVPPLATVGIGLALWDRLIIAGALNLFLVNIIATVLGSVIIFSLFGFSRLQKEEEQKIIEEEFESHIHKEAVDEAVKELAKEGSLASMRDLVNDKKDNV